MVEHCGGLRAAIEHAGDFVLSVDVANELEARATDVIVRAVGEAMEEAGIPDGAMVLMRPLSAGKLPLPNEITLVEIVNQDGNCRGVIRCWHPGEPPRLTDGKGNVLTLPEGTVEVRPVAVARGVIAQLNRGCVKAPT